MTRDILLLGEHSSGKTAFLNMILGAPVLPVEIDSYCVPPVKISHGGETGISITGYDYSVTRIASFDRIPERWNDTRYIQIDIPGHPLLGKGIALWDLPAVNHPGVHDKLRLDKFIDENPLNCTIALFFISDIPSHESIAFLKKHKGLTGKMIVVLNVPDDTEPDLLRRLEKNVRRSVLSEAGIIPVHLLSVNRLFDEFSSCIEEHYDWMQEDDWPSRTGCFAGVLKNLKIESEGAELFGILKHALRPDEKHDGLTTDMDEERLIDLALAGNAEAQYETGKKYLNRGEHIHAFNWFNRSAAQGNGSALFETGRCYENGTGTVKDQMLAVHYYRKAAALGSHEACARLGLLYYKGEGVEQDYRKALSCFARAAKDDYESLYYAALCFYYGNGTGQDKPKALNMLERAYSGGCISAGAMLGQHYETVHENFEKAALYYKAAAERYDPLAQLYLGRLYLSGRGITADEAAAARLFRLSSDAGCIKASYELGLCHLNGTGTERNDLAAFRLFIDAASKGEPSAQEMTGYCFQHGLGTAEDPKQAFRYYLLSYSAGSVSAGIRLGNCHANGYGTMMDASKAFDIYSRCAASGNPDALIKLGLCYQNGTGTAKDPDQAFRCFKSAAEQCSPEGVYRTGICFRDGTGTAANPAAGYKLLEFSASLGYGPANEKVQNINPDEHDVVFPVTHDEGHDLNEAESIILMAKSQGLPRQIKDVIDDAFTIGSENIEQTARIMLHGLNNGSLKPGYVESFLNEAIAEYLSDSLEYSRILPDSFKKMAHRQAVRKKTEDYYRAKYLVMKDKADKEEMELRKASDLKVLEVFRKEVIKVLSSNLLEPGGAFSSEKINSLKEKLTGEIREEMREAVKAAGAGNIPDLKILFPIRRVNEEIMSLIPGKTGCQALLSDVLQLKTFYTKELTQIFSGYYDTIFREIMDTAWQQVPPSAVRNALSAGGIMLPVIQFLAALTFFILNGAGPASYIILAASAVILIYLFTRNYREIKKEAISQAEAYAASTINNYISDITSLAGTRIKRNWNIQIDNIIARIG